MKMFSFGIKNLRNVKAVSRVPIYNGLAHDVPFLKRNVTSVTYSSLFAFML